MQAGRRADASCGVKPTQEPDEQHPTGRRAAHPDEPCHRTEHNPQYLPCPAAHEQSGNDEKWEQRHQQRPAAQGKPLLQRTGAALRRCKHQSCRANCRPQQHDPLKPERLIHNFPLPLHIYGTAARIYGTLGKNIRAEREGAE